MTSIPFVIGNQQHKMADVLNDLLRHYQRNLLDVATAYFNVGGWQLLRGGLNGLGNFRLLLGDEPEVGDALRIWLAAHPLEAEQRQALRPDGPNEAWLRTCEKSKIGEVFLNPIRYTHNITSGINKVGRVKRIQQIRRYTCSQKSVPSALA